MPLHCNRWITAIDTAIKRLRATPHTSMSWAILTNINAGGLILHAIRS